jgi:hypothetical protein
MVPPSISRPSLRDSLAELDLLVRQLSTYQHHSRARRARAFSFYPPRPQVTSSSRIQNPSPISTYHPSLPTQTYRRHQTSEIRFAVLTFTSQVSTVLAVSHRTNPLATIAFPTTLPSIAIGYPRLRTPTEAFITAVLRE